MNKYNDGLNNETEVHVISTYRRPLSEKTKKIISNLGTPIKVPNFDVMYSDKDNLNLNLNLNTLHQALPDDNVAGKAREFPEEDFVPEVRAKPETHKSNVGIVQARDLDPNVDIAQIEIQMGKIKEGRHKRCDVYISMMTMNDKLYTIKLTSDITNAYSEVRRSCRKSVHWSQTIQNLIDADLNGLMMGRARYKATSHRPLYQTKPNLGNVFVAYCVENNVPTILLYLFNEDPIPILLNKPLSVSQSKYYSYAGVWKKELEDL
jgi:hypothetical protein